MEISRSDILSLPNAISAAGLALAAHGSSTMNTPRGFTEMALGRSLDLADGYVARTTGQSSEFGAGIDALFDKLAGASMLIQEWRLGLAPKLSLAAIGVQNTANAVATWQSVRRHPDTELTPSRDGKYAMASQNIALGSYALAGLFKEAYPSAHKGFRFLGHAATAVGVGYFGVRSTAYYFARSK
jgi:phosphatidylglycerophosphate synthase